MSSVGVAGPGLAISGPVGLPRHPWAGKQDTRAAGELSHYGALAPGQAGCPAVALDFVMGVMNQKI